MATTDSATVVDSWVAAWNNHDIDAAVELLHGSFTRHDPNSPTIEGPEGQRAFMTAVFAAFPDLEVSVTHRVAQNDLVAVRLEFAGTHSAEMWGVPATGVRAAFQSQELFRVVDEQILEQHVVVDALGVLQQLGAVPAPQ